MPLEYKYTVECLKQKYKIKHPWIYWLLILLSIAILASLPLIYVEVSSQSRGIIRSRSEDVSLKTVVQGRVKKADLYNNKKVSEGDTLFIISNESLSAELAMQEELLFDLNERIHDLDLLCGSGFCYDSLRTPLYMTDYLDYSERLSELALKDSISSAELERNRLGSKAGVVSDYDYHQSIAEQRSVKAETEILKQQKILEWNSSRQKAEQERTTAEGAIKRLHKEMLDYTITAPISGTIVNFAGHSENAFVYASETIASISPDSLIIVECYVEPADIAYIKKGQLVKLQFDALDYNQWGLGMARVSDIDNNITINQESSYFIVRCELMSDSLYLKSGYGASIRKGMTLTARFRLTDRSLWQLLFDKIDDWVNPKIIDVEQPI